MRICALVLICVTLAVPVMAASLIPVIPNAGFEEVVPGNDAPGWGFYTRANAGFHSETTNPHSGKRCLVFWDKSDVAPEVYERLACGVGVLPDTEYELSVWVRGEEVAPGSHFTDWDSYTMNLPSGTYDWRRVTLKFRTKPSQTGLNLGINVVNRCALLAIDDVSLRPIGVPIEGAGLAGSVLAPGQVQGDDAKAFVNISLESEFAGIAHAIITAGKQTVFGKAEPIKPGENTFEWEWNSGTLPVKSMDLVVRVADEKGKLVASAGRKIEKLSAGVLSADLDAVEARLKEFDALYDKCKAKGIPLDYPTATRTMLTQMIPLERIDIRKGDLRRAGYAVTDFNRSLDIAIAELRAYLANPKCAPNAVRYRTSDMEIDGVSFIADKQDAKGAKSRGPVFFCGVGHFYQVRKDIFRWPGYGVNIIQIEVGPGVTFPKEDEVNLKPAQDIVRVLDEAAKKNVKVNILLSPHYFPKWAMAKWPSLGQGGGGFLGFNVDAPEAKQVIEKFLRTVVPLFKDHPALHSFCLSNEPLFDRSQTPNAKPMWAAYLAKVHCDVKTMNERYGTSHASFDDVPMPGNGDFGAPQFYDYVVFNQERFAGWHQWMADVIHEIAPDVPVHAKVMGWTFFTRNCIAWGTSPEMFGEFGQVNGNDCTMLPGDGLTTIGWGTQNMVYDLQRSMNGKPVFNSENHLTIDGSVNYVGPQHFRTALWQGAIHGQGATTIWVWERTLDPKHPAYAATTCFYGNVMDRPGCAEAVGRTCLDLNRFADEVTALEKAKAPVAIVYSMASMARNPKHVDAMSRAYTALNFCGVKVDFVSEKQLAEGKGMQYRLIVLPEATHLPEDAIRGLTSLADSTCLIVVGDAPSKDPYDKVMPAGGNWFKPGATYPSDADAEKVLWPGFRAMLGKLGALPDVRVVDAKTGAPVWGVEWLPATVKGRTVINIMNLSGKPVDVKVLAPGAGNPMAQQPPLNRVLDARDLLSIGGTAKMKTLLPLTPVLAEVSR